MAWPRQSHACCASPPGLLKLTETIQIMTDVAFITTCKGRLHHIQQTLPLMVAESPAEIVVVDYGCPQRVGDWVAENYPAVTVVRVDDDPGFCVPRARNLGAQRTTSPWLCFIDADVKVTPGWTRWMADNLDSGSFYRAAKIDGERIRDTWGTVLCSRKGFIDIGGYDEAFRGWGGEDDDLYDRLTLAGYTESDYPSGFVTAIHHDDDERTLFHDIKEKELHHFVNRFYREAKLDLMRILGRDLPLVEREAIMKKVKAEIMTWNLDPSRRIPGFTANFSIPAWLPEPFRMVKNYTISLSMQTNDRIQPPPVG
jgi:glycosyltransferase involved in cell wall biosynthesis